ncbi:MIP/aquaporin family protein [Arthrobacter sp. GCM10027362]|uniref:MIP/aquaporin family protein n=1 Tax=Arthrobacter sp. GCM10027362 TaxID=3273379 RepID=UPI003636BCE9
MSLKQSGGPVEQEPAETVRAPREGYSLSARIGAEAVGAFLLVGGALGIGMFNPQGGFAVPFGFGFAVAAAMLAFGYISGGHFNPAITLGTALAGRTAWKHVLPYIVAQVAGASLATTVLWVILRSHPANSQSQSLFAAISNHFDASGSSGFSLAGVFLAEAVCTALLVAVYLGATARAARPGSAPFAVGLALSVLTAFLLPVSNAGLNPARSTATVYFGDGTAAGQLWLFWAAPLLGAVIAGLIYRSAEGAPQRATGKAAEGKAAKGKAADFGYAKDDVDVTGADKPQQEPDNGAAEAKDFFDGQGGPASRGNKSAK